MKNLLTFLMLLLAISAISQDRIIKKNSEIINCKVSEIGADEVKYYYAENPKLVFGIDKALLERIEFATGEVIEIEANTFSNPEYYVNQSKHALKVNFLSPIFGTTEFAYEKNIKPGRSWEASVGIIGLGGDLADVDPRGISGKFSYKMIRNPDYYLNRMHYSHILKGAYFAPEIAIKYMSFDDWEYQYNIDHESIVTRENNLAVAFMLKVGKQWIFNDVFLIDIYAGIGYGIGGENNDGLPYGGFIVGPSEVPIAFTGGIKIGWVFGKE